MPKQPDKPTAADIVEQHKQQLAQIEQSLVASFDALDQAADPSLTDLASLATLVDTVRERQVVPTPHIEQPSIASLAASNNPGKQVVKRNGGNQALATTRVTARTHIPTGEPTVTEALLAALSTGRLRAVPDGTQQLIASVKWDYPSDRQLSTDDAAITTSQLTAALAPSGQTGPSHPANTQANQGISGNQSLVAYGGICQPIAVDYNIPTFASSDRPVKDGLPQFQATRGGINYNSPPSLADVVGGTSVWTIADDTGGTKTKPCLTIACAPTKTAMVYGIPTCTVLGNMQQRYNPELVTAWLTTTEAAAARVAELTLLTAIAAGSTAVTATAAVNSLGLGAARALLPILDQAAAGIRYRQRQTRTAPTLRVILPEWVKDLVRADIARELAHDNDTTSGDALALAEQRLSNWFAVRNINPIWALEDIAGTLAAAQAPGALNAWPTSTIAYMFAEGTWVFLDGGRLDVGFVRDSTLNSQNNVSMFVEPFEAVALRGLESIALQINLSPTGLSAGSVDTGAA